MRVLIVVNPRAGGSETGLYDFIRLLGMYGAEIVVRYLAGTQSLPDIVADASDFDRIVAAGGDGTVSAICYATRDSRIPILAYPGGTANLLASNLGMPSSPQGLSEVLLGGEPVDFDLGEIEHKDASGKTVRSGFALIAGAGFDAAIMEGAEKLKPTLGAAAYMVSAMSNLTPTTARFEIDVDGEHIRTDGMAVLLVNFGKIQFDLAVTPNTDPRDGKLEVAVLRGKHVVGLLPAVAAAVLDRVGDYPDRSTSVDLYSGSTIQVKATPKMRMQADGDTIDAVTPFTARVLERATTLLVPDTSPYAQAPDA